MANSINGKTVNKSSVTSTLAFIVFFVLYCGSSSNYNLPIYQQNYETLFGPSLQDVSEWLYYSFEVIGNSLQISFKYFHFILTATAILILQSVVRKWIGEYALLFYLLFFIFPVGEAISAFRDGLAMCLLTLAFPYLADFKKRNIIIYATIIFIASAIHRSFVIYYLFLLVGFFDNIKNTSIKSSIKSIYRIFIIVCVGLAFMPSLLSSVMNSVAEFVSDTEKLGDQSVGYFEGLGNWGFLLYIGFQLICIYTLYKMRLLSEDYLTSNDKVNNLTRMVLYCDIFLLFLVIAYKANSNFFRIFWNLMPINYISLILLSQNSKSKKKSMLFVVFFIFIWVFGINWGTAFFEENYYPMFNDNWILKLDF